MKHVASVINHSGFSEEVGSRGEWFRPSTTAKTAKASVVRRLLNGQRWAWAGLGGPSQEFVRVFVQSRNGKMVEGRIEFGDERRLMQLKDASEHGANPSAAR